MLCGSLDGRGVWGRMNTCICMTEFLRCSPEAILTLLISYACMLSHFSHDQLFVTLWTVARQAPLPLGFSRQDYWSGLPSPPPGGLPCPGVKLMSLTSPVLVDGFSTASATQEAWVERSPGETNGYPLKYSCQENSMDPGS